MIKNIVFDLGGTILTEDNNWLYTLETKNLLKVTDEKLGAGWNTAWPLARNGKISENEFLSFFKRCRNRL